MVCFLARVDNLCKKNFRNQFQNICQVLLISTAKVKTALTLYYTWSDEIKTKTDFWYSPCLKTKSTWVFIQTWILDKHIICIILYDSYTISHGPYIIYAWENFAHWAKVSKHWKNFGASTYVSIIGLFYIIEKFAKAGA